jgi:hypothetical protein
VFKQLDGAALAGTIDWNRGKNMRYQPLAITVFALLASIGTVSPAGAQAVDSTTLRPTDVAVKILNDPDYSGTYNSSGISRICGKLDLMMPHRANSFNVEFPDAEPNLEVRSVSFDADTLPTGSTTNGFYLSVGIRTPGGGTPPLFVVRAKDPQYNEPGTATRSGTAWTDTLRIKGVATKGTKVEVTLTIVCHPRT